MASVWLQNGKQPAKKLCGNLPFDPTSRHGFLARFRIEVGKAAKRYDADIIYQTELEALLQPRPKQDGETLTAYAPICMWGEPCSPPSAPETGQPKLLYGHGITEPGSGILVTRKGATTLEVPKP